MNEPKKNTLLYILMVLAMTAWGGSWPSGKMIAGTTAPEVMIFWRFSITFICFAPVIWLMKRSFHLPPKAVFWTILGALFIVSYNKFYFTGLEYGLAAAGGIVVTTLNPILTFILAALFFRNKVYSKEVLGIILGLTAGLVLVEIWHISYRNLLLSGNLFFLGCSVSWASLTIVSQHSRKYVSPLIFSFYLYGFAALIDFLFALPYGVTGAFQFGAVFWLNIIYLALFATIFATTIYFTATVRLGAHKASSFIFMVPFSAVIISWLALGEIPKISTIIGGIIGLSAVYLINSRTRDKGARSVIEKH